MSVGQMSVGQMPVGQMSVGKMSVGQMSVEQMSVFEMSAGLYIWQKNICQVYIFPTCLLPMYIGMFWQKTCLKNMPLPDVFCPNACHPNACQSNV